MKIVGLTGFAKSGKSTAATILKEMGGQEVAFAKHLKDVCSVVFGVPREHFDDQNYKEVPFEFSRVICSKDIERILNYFEVPDRFIPSAKLAHDGTIMNTPRFIAQYVGTEILRAIDTDVHIKMAFKLNENSSAKFLICSDMRFDNELVSVQREDGLTIGISREAATPANLENLHGSEREIPDLIERSDLKIQNETTIEEFQHKVKSAVELFLRIGPPGK